MPQRLLLMSPAIVAIGGLLAFFTVVLMVVVLPIATFRPPVSPNWLPLSNAAVLGRSVYLANGCVYCHSGYTRPQDVAVGQYYLYPRIAAPGDYHGEDQAPNILGSERTGPDLSQEGGMHPDDWHQAHYANPRNTQPLSIMPQFSFWDPATLKAMIAFNQENGGKEAALRYAAVTTGNNLMGVNGAGKDPEQFFPDLVERLRGAGSYKTDGKASDTSSSGLPWMAVWMLNSFERSYWLTKDPLPVTVPNLVRGKAVFLERCSGCHGADGAGNGPAASFLAPKPFDFTATGPTGNFGPFSSDGDFYHRILTAGPGTAMENFGTRLSVEDIWRVVLFLRTIPQGSLAEPGTLPTEAMYKEWEAPPPLLKYIETHSIEEGPGVIGADGEGAFEAAAHWVAPGLGKDDEPVLVGGKLPVDFATLTNMIRTRYFQFVRQAYEDAKARGEELPPEADIMDTTQLDFHPPS